ncbi:probable sodium-coupled neutral amino acid transporter 6 [Diadema antillarum]|uniref:probable sodium-coupled neutral amino acid transporter 6 n=1 Tax=Diadema antillarum TaxID=105358 RepID=UPI003A844E5E
MESKNDCHRLMAGRVEDANEDTFQSFHHNVTDAGNEETALLSASVQEIGLERVKRPVAGNTSFGLSVFNLMNAILGSGILGLPYAMAQSGIILFSFMLTFVAVTANYSIHLLLKMCDLTGHKSYEDIGHRALGVPGKLMAACSILLQNTGAMSSYLFIVKNEMPAVIEAFTHEHFDRSAWYLNGTYLVLLIVVVVILPLACLPKIGFLGYTSAFSILCMVFFTAVIIFKKFGFPCPIPVYPGHNSTGMDSGAMREGYSVAREFAVQAYQDHANASECRAKLFTITLQTAYTIPTMAFSFVCHTAVLPIYAELSKPSKQRMQNVAITSIGICFSLYMIASLFGYLTFYDAINSEVLYGYSMYNPDDMLILIVRIAVVIAIVFTVPIIHYPGRIALLMIFGTAFPSYSRFSWIRHFLSTFFLLSVVCTLALCVPTITQIFGITGATASTSLVFFLPSLFYLKLGREPFNSRPKILATCLLVASIIFLVLSLSTIIYGMVSADTST